MYQVSVANIDHIRSRFIGFNDGVIQKIAISYGENGAMVDIEVQAKDLEAAGGWSLVKIGLSECHQIKFVENPRASYQVLSNGIHFILESSWVGVELGHFVDPPDSMPELETSPCCAVGRKCVIDSTPISNP